MAATLVQTKEFTASYSSPASGAFGSNVTAGSLIIVVVVHNTDGGEAVSGITDTQSNTYTKIDSQAVGDIAVELWYAYNANAGATTISVACSGSPDLACIAREYSGLTTTDPLDKSSKTATSSGTSHTSAATATTTQANELVFAALGVEGNRTYTLGSGYGNLDEQNGTDIYEAIGVEDKSVTSTGAQTATFTINTASTGAFIVATFKEASTAIIEQEGFAFGDDDGNEAAHTLDTQDTNLTAVLGAKTIRALLDTDDDPGGLAFKLKYQKNGSGGYSDVGVGATTENTALYYFNSYGANTWDAGVANTVDGNEATYGNDNDNGGTLLLDGNTCPGTDLGTITKVEIACYWSNNGAGVYQDHQPQFGGSSAGDNHNDTTGARSASLDTWHDITSDTNAPGTWAWSDVVALDDLITLHRTASQTQIRVVYIRVTYTTPNEVYVSTSSNVAAGGEATTARLAAPSGKTTSNFTTGRRWDDENGSDSIDIASAEYTELEWVVTIGSPGTTTDYYEFRVYNGDTALDTYTVTPKWTIGSPAAFATLEQEKTGNGGGYVNTTNFTFDSAVTTGNSIVLLVRMGSGSVATVSDDKSNTYTLVQYDTTAGGWLYVAQNVTGGTVQVTISTDAAYDDIVYLGREYSVSGGYLAVDVSAENVEGSYVNSHPTGTTGATADNDELVVAVYVGTANASYTVGGSYTNLTDTDGNDVYASVVMADLIVSTTGTQAATFDSGAAYMQGWGAIVALKLATGSSYQEEYTEAITLVDAITRSESRTLTDVVTLVDSITRSISRTFTDALSLVGSFTRSFSLILSDTITLVDSLSRSFSKLLQETITLVGSITRSISRTISDVITLVDSVVTSVILTLFLTLTETLVLNDSFTKSISRLFQETLTLVDSIYRSIKRTLSDSLALVDSIVKKIVRIFLDSITLVDIFPKSFTKLLEETLTLVDSVYKATKKTFTDVISVVDDFSTRAFISLILTEIISLKETFYNRFIRKIPTYTQTTPSSPTYTEETPNSASYTEETPTSASYTSENSSTTEYTEERGRGN